MPGTPLPPVTSPEVTVWATYEPNTLSAYRVCLEYESKLATSEDKVRLVRLLGYLLLYAPRRIIRSEVANWIHSRKPGSDLTDLGEFFENHVIVAFKKFKGRTPAPTSHPSRPSFEGTRSAMIAEIKEAPKNHAKAKEQALIRDNYRCAVTGFLHTGAPADVKAACDLGVGTVYTECAHIIPEATFFGVSPNEAGNRKLDYSASILAVLKRFGVDIMSFNGPKVHSLSNVITLEKNIHEAFDRLELYFEVTKVQDCYKVVSYNNVPNKCEKVTFVTPDAKKLPLPSSHLLTLHATCCKVAHLSGSAEYIDKVFDDAERLDVLANDGTSSDLLHYQLLLLSNGVTAVQG